MEEDYDPQNFCERNGLYCDKAQYGELGFWAKIRMWYHLLLCKPCREYQRKNAKLSENIEKSGVSTLTTGEKEEIERQLHQKAV